MKKNTSDLLSELKECDSFGSFYNNNQLQFTETNVGQYLNSLVERKNLKKSAVIKSSELSEIYGYQIFSGIRRPDRSKLLPIVLAMHLTVEETQELFKACGYSMLYAKDPRDSAIIFAIEHGLTVSKTNELLTKYGFAAIG